MVCVCVCMCTQGRDVLCTIHLPTGGSGGAPLITETKKQEGCGSVVSVQLQRPGVERGEEML